MKFVGYLILFLSILSLGVVSCSEDETQAEGIEPFIEVTFINVDSLSKIDTVIAELNSAISVIDARIVAIDTAENKGELLEEKDSLNSVKSELNSEKSTLNKTKSTINAGRVNLRELRGNISAGVIEENPFDSSALKQFPLNSGASNVRFFTLLTMANETFRVDTIDFTYNVDIEYKENQVNALVSELEIPFHSFDSVKLRCRDSTCISNEALLTIYF